MSLKTILVHVDDGPHCGARIEASMHIARSFQARLVGIYLAPVVDLLSSSVAAMLPEEVVTARLRERRTAEKAAEHAFLEAAAKMRVDRIEWRAPEGDMLEAALAHGRCTDLFVLGQHDVHEQGGSSTQELIGTVLLGSGRPILVVPYIGAPGTIGSNVLVATDGGREAARAIADALPILEQATRVNVLIGARGVDGSDFEQASKLVATWLRDHGIEAKAERFSGDTGPVGELLLSRAADLGSDLIVMGGYGQARLRELVLGGMTRTILSSMTIPVLMSH